MRRIIVGLCILVAAAATFYYGFPEQTVQFLTNVQKSRLGLVQKAIRVDDHRGR